MKKLTGILVLLATLLGLSATASAAYESVELSLEAAPASGPLYREVYRPVAASLDIRVSVPFETPKVTQLKVSNVTFPPEMDFFPNPKLTPACPKSKIGPSTNLGLGIIATVDLCPKSVVGTGTSAIHPAGLSNALIDDARLVIFNAGRTARGRPKLTIYGYSKAAGTGVLMNGVLASDGQLKILLGILPYASSVSEFTMGIPGDPLEVEDSQSSGGTRTIKGLDPGFLRARCTDGTWHATGQFVFGDRDGATGQPIGEETQVASNPFDLECSGLTGKPRVAISKISGPRSMKAGSKGVFVLKLANNGTSSAKSMKINVTGGAKGAVTIDKFAPGTIRSVKVPVKAATRPSRNSKVKVRVSAARMKPVSGTTRVRIG